MTRWWRLPRCVGIELQNPAGPDAHPCGRLIWPWQEWVFADDGRPTHTRCAFPGWL